MHTAERYASKLPVFLVVCKIGMQLHPQPIRLNANHVQIEQRMDIRSQQQPISWVVVVAAAVRIDARPPTQ